MFWVIGYILVALAIILWDAYIGFGFEFPDLDIGPNAVVTGFFWPIGLPVIFTIVLSNFLKSAKNRRLDKARAKHKIRIAAEEEQEKIIQQIEEEMNHVKSKDQNKR